MDGKKIVAGLVARGLSPQHAAFLAGHMEQESSFNPSAWNAGEKAGGLIQWRKDRLQNLLKFAKDNGKKPGAVDTQLDFLVHEMTDGSEKSAGSVFLSAKTPQQMNKALRGYIRYGDNSDQKRFENAQKWMGAAPAAVAPAPASQQASPATIHVNPAGTGAPADASAEFDDSAIDAFMSAGEPAAQAAPAPVAETPDPVAPAPQETAGNGLPGWVTGQGDQGGDLSDDDIDSFMSSGGDEPKIASADSALPGNAAPGQVVAKNAAKMAAVVNDMLPEAPAPIPQKSNVAWKGDFGQTEADLKAQATGGNSLLQGATLGAADEIGAAIAAPLLSAKNMLTGEGPTNLGTNYAEASERARSMLAREQELAPKTAIGLEIAGGVLTGGGVLKGGVSAVTKAPSMANKLIEGGKLVATSAGIGATQGYMSGEGKEDRRYRAKVGGLTGAAAAPVAAVALKAGGAAARAGKDFFKAFDPFLPGGERRVAERILTEKLGGSPAMPQGGEIVPGSVPTLAETSGSANVAALQRVVRDKNPDAFVSRETEQVAARQDFIDNLRGNGLDLDQAEKALSSQTDQVLKGVFQQSQAADASPVVAKIDSILGGSGGGRDAIQSVMAKVRSKLVDDKGNLISDDPEYLYNTVRKQIGDMLDPVAVSSDPAAKLATSELKAVQRALDDTIESGAPGFKQYLADYSQAKQPINSMRYLQGLDLFNAEGAPTLAKVDRALKSIEKQRRSRGANDAKSLTKAQIGKLEDLRNDLLRGQNKVKGKAHGSDTHQNLASTYMLEKALPFGVGKLASAAGPQVTGGAIGGAIGAAINGPLGFAVGAPIGQFMGRVTSKAMAGKNARVEQEIENLLLNPKAFRARGGRRQKLSGNKLTRAVVSGVTSQNPLISSK